MRQIRHNVFETNSSSTHSLVMAIADEFYMGDDGAATMYADLVEKKFARSSTAVDRYDLMSDIKDMFKIVRTT